MTRVELHYWSAEEGYFHSETVDNIEENISAEEYVKRLFDKGGGFDIPDYLENEFYAINVEMYDENDRLVSEYFLGES